MAHYAKVLDGTVIDTIVAEEDFINSFVASTPGNWIQTSYNTKGGVHSEGGTPLRKNYATKGMIYDGEADAFHMPQPFPSWTLNSDTYIWSAPVVYPDDGKEYTWNEDTTNWVEIE